MTGFVRLIAVLVLLVLPVMARAGTSHALLIGVSEYDASIRSLAPNLSGPPNDVALMYRSLRRLGLDADQITVLADGTPHVAYQPLPYAPRRPTRVAILEALAQLTTQVGPGDFVTVFMAGHGSQTPALKGAEADGLDEVFLPVDVSVEDRGGQPVLINTLRDDEIGQAIAALSARGAFVWLIVDACHSGSFERSATGLTPRVLPRALPLSAQSPPQPPFAARPQGPAPGTAGFAGFYAAAAGQLAVEGTLSGDRDGPVHGLFTWTLARALGQTMGPSGLRGLSRQVRAAYWTWGMSAPDPVFAGDLARPLPGRSGRDIGFALRAGPEGFIIDAGLMDGLAPGDILALDDAPGQPVLFARVGTATLTQASAIAIADDPDWPDQTQARLDKDRLPASLRNRWLADRAPLLTARRVRATPLGFLRVALPDDGAAARALIRRMPRAMPVAAQDHPDLLFSIENAALIAHWSGGQPVVLGPLAQPDIWTSGLDRLTRALTILHGAGQFAASEAATALDIDVALQREPAQTPCPAPGPATAARPGRIVTPCDQVTITLHNSGAQALDIAPFYLGVDASLYYLSGYTNGAYLGLRLAPGHTETVIYTEDPGNSGGGRMYLVIVADPVTDPESAPKDLRGLAHSIPGLRNAAPPIPMGAVVLPLIVQEVD